MTGESRPPALPFIFRYAAPIPHAPLHTLRYDHERQISQVLVEGQWVDAIDVRMPDARSTRITRVALESTDDQ